MKIQQAQSQKRSVSYRKPVVEQRTTSKIKQGFFNLSTNVTYTIGGGISKLKNFIRSDIDRQHSIIYINGKKQANQQQAKNKIATFVWFSYRRMPGLTNQIHCDTGWGCLIRVGQMALAAGLKVYFQSKSKEQSNINASIIVSFLQNGGKNQKYSLKKIVQRARVKFDLDYGKWFTTHQICQILTDLHSKDPMRGSENLQLINFKNSTIFIADVYNKMNKTLCICSKKRILCPNCTRATQKQQKQKDSIITASYHEPKLNNFLQYKNNIIMRSQINPKKAAPQKKVLAFVSCQLGFKVIGQKQFKQLIQLLSMECSLGIIGGIPKKGMYFIGYQNNQLIYLDPHYVQDEVSLSTLHMKTRSFECKEYRKFDRISLDPSMSFVFFIDSLETLKKIQTKIQQMHSKYENPIISIQWINQYSMDAHRISQVHGAQEEQNDLENSFIQELQ